MLEVSTLRSPSRADQHAAGFPTSDCGEDDCFMVDDNLLDYIDFTCCDVPSFFDADGDILPDLEVDPTELLAEFEDQPTVGSPAYRRAHQHGGAAEMKPPDDKEEESPGGEEEEKKVQKKNGGDEVLRAVTTWDSAAAAGSSDSKSSASAEGQSKKTKPSKKCHGNKKKGKVEWTPELHRRFVQAVEQLGIDKAVPSRILEIMGIQCLTRHNIASHLQKYRSHRKHLMAREAEAATWAHKRQMYAAAAATGVQVPAAPRTTTKDMPAASGPPWVVPTIGFPPPPFCRPLHVWGHPPTAVEAAAAPMLPVWPRHLAPPRPWAYCWHQQRQQYNAAGKWGPTTTLCGVPPPMPPPAMVPRFPVPHPIMCRPIPPPPQTAGSKLASRLQLQLDAHPSKESIDAAIGDVLVKPWLPLPLGLKPPSLDSVMSELHRQGIPKIPPAARNSSGS